MRKISLTTWIIIAMVVGVLIGWLNHEFWPTTDMAQILGPFSTIFISLIKCIVVPLIFGSLVVGIAGHGDDLKRVGKLAIRSIIYFEVVTTMALIVGLAMVNLVKPGVGVALSAASADTGETARDDQDHVRLGAHACGADVVLRRGGAQRGAPDRGVRRDLRGRPRSREGEGKGHDAGVL